MTEAGTLDLLLRDRRALRARIAEGGELTNLARTMLATLLLSGAVFGAVLGAYRGGAQIAFAAIKLPLAVLLTAAICAPALTAFHAALGRRADLRKDLALVLSSLALGSLTLAALAPVILLAVLCHARYHVLILITVACCTVGGVIAMVSFHGGLDSGPRGRGLVWIGLVALFAVVGAQMSWMGRPYLVRPRTPQAPFLRDVDGSFFDAVATTVRSAQGHYSRPYAPLLEE